MTNGLNNILEEEMWICEEAVIRTSINVEDRRIFCQPSGGPDYLLDAEVLMNAVNAMAKRNMFNEAECKKLIEALSDNYANKLKEKN